MMDFVAWDKIPRLFKDMVVTEKIDGTNAAVIIESIPNGRPDLPVGYESQISLYGDGRYTARTLLGEDGSLILVGAQSRTRLIAPNEDNFGFARWVWANAEDLVRLLGVGRHFGEWWGSGIQRGYGLQKGEKRFSLFNRHRYPTLVSLEAAGVTGLVGLVPLLAEGPFDLDDVRHILAELRKNGSSAAPGFMNPEGVVVWHAAARQTLKAFVDDDGQPKSLSLDSVRPPANGPAIREAYDIADHLDALAKEPRGFA